jgi:hypothetical protein
MNLEKPKPPTSWNGVQYKSVSKSWNGSWEHMNATSHGTSGTWCSTICIGWFSLHGTENYNSNLTYPTYI